MRKGTKLKSFILKQVHNVEAIESHNSQLRVLVTFFDDTKSILYINPNRTRLEIGAPKEYFIKENIKARYYI